MNIQEQIKKLQDEILAIKNTKIQNGLTDYPLFDEMIEDNEKEIDALNAKGEEVKNVH